MGTSIGQLLQTIPSFEVDLGARQVGTAAVTLSASASSAEAFLCESHSAQKIKAITFVPLTVLTGVGAAGAGATLKVSLRRAGSLVGSAGAVVSQQFNLLTNAAAWVSFAFTVLGTKKLAKGDVLTWQWVQGGTGLALPAGTFTVEFEPSNPTR